MAKMAEALNVCVAHIVQRLRLGQGSQKCVDNQKLALKLQKAENSVLVYILAVS